MSTSVIPSRSKWSRTSNPFVWLSSGEKKMEPNQLFLICIWWCVRSWLIWVSIKILIFFGGFSTKLKCQILLQGIFDATNIVIYHAVTNKKVSWISFTFCLVIKMVLDLLKWLKNKLLWKREKNYENMNFYTKGKVILRRQKEFMNFFG